MKAAAATLIHSSILQIDPSLHLLLPSTFHKPTIIVNRRRNHKITFHHPPSLFPCGHLKAMYVCKFRYAVKADVEMNGGDDNGDDVDDMKKASRGAVGPGVVLACVIGAMCLTTRPVCRPALALSSWLPWSQTETEEMDLPVWKGSTLDRLLKAEKEKPEMNVDKILKDFKDKLEDPKRIEYDDLKEDGRKLAFGEDRKKADEAFNLVKVKYNEVKGTHGEHDLDTLELGLALVEMYIYRREYLEAEKLLAQIEHDFLNPEDAKLYKVVLSLMMEKTDAWNRWNEYAQSFQQGRIPCPKVITFKQFEKKMINLKKRVEELKKKEMGL